MRTHLKVLFTASLLTVTLGVGLTACSTLSAVVSPAGVDSARKAAGAAMTVYADSWQPLLAVYANQKKCGTAGALKPPFCNDPPTYRKLYDLDGAASTCIVAATIALSETNPDFSGVSSCISHINNAELAFAQAGIVVKVTP